MIQATKSRWFNGGDTYVGLEWIPVTCLHFPVNILTKEENRLIILRKSSDGLPVTSIGYYVSPIAIVKADPEYPTVVGFVSTNGQELEDVIG